jgi:hypothetical protein
MAMEIVKLKEPPELPEPNWPRYKRHKSSKAIIRFTGEFTGLCVCPGTPESNVSLLQYRSSLVSCNSAMWEDLPAGTIISLEIKI